MQRFWQLSIPIYEIITLEKKMTAFVIPNAIQITTRQAKYNFASFLSRDTTFDVIYNIWRLARPEDTQSLGSGSVEQAVDQIIEGTIIGGGVNGDAVIVGKQVGDRQEKGDAVPMRQGRDTLFREGFGDDHTRHSRTDIQSYVREWVHEGVLGCQSKAYRRVILLDNF